VTPNQLLGDTLGRALASVDDVEIVKIRSDLTATTVAAAELSDIMLLDAQFPEPPLEFVSAVHDQFPETRIVVVQAPEFPQHVLPYIQAGAVGHVEGTSSFQELLGILRTVYQGGAVIDPTLANLVIKQMIQLATELGSPLSAGDGQHDLTEREMEVLAEAAEGKSNAEIGEALFIQEGTVKNHVHNILRKLDLRDRGQAALWYAHWLRLQEGEENGADEPPRSHLAPAEYMQEISNLAHPRGMVFAATATVPVRDGIERALGVLCERLGWPIGHVFLLDERTNRLASSGIWRLPAPRSFPNLQLAIANLSIPLSDEFGGSSILRGDPIYVTDIQQEPDSMLAGLADTVEIHSVLMVPLMLDEAVIGLMAFFSTAVEDKPSKAVFEGLQEASNEVSEFIEEPVALADLPRKLESEP
jgi:DNA-binding NarL/FixJ family response regulator